MTSGPYVPSQPGGYERRIGRYGPSLARAFTAAAGVQAGWRVLDVGAGTGALADRLAELVGAANVAAADPAGDDLAACQRRVPGIVTAVAAAEALPFPDGSFDAVLSQLVLGHLADGPAAAGEMVRVARPGATVAACVWDFAEGMTVLRAFWDAATAVDQERAARHDQAATLAYGTPAEMERLWREAGLDDVSSGTIEASARYEDFDDLWQPMLLTDGAPGRFLDGMPGGARRAVRDRLFDRLDRPQGPFRLTARALYVSGTAPRVGAGGGPALSADPGAAVRARPVPTAPRSRRSGRCSPGCSRTGPDRRG